MRGWSVHVVLAFLLAGCADGPSRDGTPEQAGPPLVCGPACDVDADGSEGAGAEPSISVDPSDPRHAVVGSFTYEFADGGQTPSRFWLWSHVTFDGGGTWASAPLPGGPEAGPTHPFATYSNSGDPGVLILPSGKVLYTGVVASGVYPELVRNELFVARSDDGGLTYPRIDIVSPGIGLYTSIAKNLPQNHIPSFALGSDGTIMLAWILTNAPGMLEGPEDSTVFENDLLVALSQDDGETWSAPSLAARRFFFGPSPVVAPDGGLHVAFYRSPGGHGRCCDGTTQVPTDILLTSSHDGGATWNDRSIAEGAAMSAPSLAVAPDGRLYLATVRAEEPEPAPSTAPNRAVPILLWSDDAGETWSEPVVVDEPAVPGKTMPRVTVDSDGVAYIVYYMPIAEGETEVRAVAFADGVLGTPIVVTTESIDPGAALRDYFGLDAATDGAMAAWVGGRWPDTDIHVSRVRLVE